MDSTSSFWDLEELYIQFNSRTAKPTQAEIEPTSLLTSITACNTTHFEHNKVHALSPFTRHIYFAPTNANFTVSTLFADLPGRT